MEFQSVYPLLYYGKIKLFCTTLRQIQQGVYKPVELFFACCDVVHPLHKLVGPIMHIISMKFQSVYPLLYYGKIKLFFTGFQQIWQGVYKPVEWFFACCDVVHPLHNLVGPIMNIISMKFQSVYPLLYNSKIKFSAQVCGKFGKMFTSLLSVFLLVVMLCTLCTILQGQ